MEEIVMQDAVWSYIAAETTRERYGFREQRQYYGTVIADEVIKGNLLVEDLRNCVVWAGILAHEAVEAEIMEEDVPYKPIKAYMEDGFEISYEALARLLLHSSVATALKAVGDERRRAAHRADYQRRGSLLASSTNDGLFRLEARDLGLNGLDDLLEQVKLRKGKI